MRKIILNVAVSLDGLIEGPKGEYDWCFTDQDYGMSEFLNQTDAIFFGRKSYELQEGMEKDYFPNHKKYLFSNNWTSALGETTLISGDVTKSVEIIRQQSGKNIWLFGGADLTSFFLNKNLIDELWLAVHPIILGAGKPLFTDLSDRLRFDLFDSKTYSSGLIQLFYRRLPTQ